MKDYINRMMNERNELYLKLGKLETFISKNYGSLDNAERVLMHKQNQLMRDYMYILDARISHAIVKEQLKEDSEEDEK